MSVDATVRFLRAVHKFGKVNTKKHSENILSKHIAFHFQALNWFYVWNISFNLAMLMGRCKFKKWPYTDWKVMHQHLSGIGWLIIWILFPSCNVGVAIYSVNPLRSTRLCGVQQLFHVFHCVHRPLTSLVSSQLRCVIDQCNVIAKKSEWLVNLILIAFEWDLSRSIF